VKPQTAIVTGGAGFIGSHLVELLLTQGFKVKVIDNLVGGRLSNIESLVNNSLIEFLNQDILDIPLDSTFFREVDFVFHLAGIADIVPSIEDPIDYMAVNVLGTVRMLELSRRNNVKRFVYAASSSCYGLADTPTSETNFINPRYPYALSKFQGEQAAFHWNQVYSLPVNSICIFNAYGPRVRTNGVYGAVFGVFLKQKLSGAPLTIVGDGSQKRDFVFVTDVASAFLKAAQCEAVGERFNIGTGNPQSILRLSELIGGPVVFIPKRPGEPDITHANISKSVTTLGWTPSVSFESGVQLMLDNISNWNDAPLWSPELISKSTESWFKYLGPK
jgi:UDP-glucose 4-epimerase